MAAWDDILTERDKAVFAKAGFGARQGFGSKPALIIIDVNYNYVGEDVPILQSIETWRSSCGEEGWAAVRSLQQLLETVRDKDVPVFYTTNPERRAMGEHGRRAAKVARAGEDLSERAQQGTQIVAEVAPRPDLGERVIVKDKASAFFGTSLVSYLIELGVDQLVLAGTSTSGCVRATAVDACCYNLNVAVIEECVFDRGQSSHKMALFDMHTKWADVVSIDEAIGYFASLPDRPEV